MSFLIGKGSMIDLKEDIFTMNIHVHQVKNFPNFYKVAHCLSYATLLNTAPCTEQGK